MKNTFFEKYEDLKKAEKWQEIIDLGESALAESDITQLDQATIYIRLSSCNFYLGKFSEAKDCATTAYVVAPSNDSDLIANSCYLASSAYRSIASKQKLSGNDNKRSVELAHKWINFALKDIETVSAFTKGKIYFNAGALAQDVDKNNDKASEHFLSTMPFFKKGSDDFNRTAIRYIRLQLEMGNQQTAEVKLTEVTPFVEPESKTMVHLLLLQAKVYTHKKQYHRAYSCVLEGLELAGKKDMVADAERLTELKDTLVKKDPSVATLSETSWRAFVSLVKSPDRQSLIA